MTESPRHSRPLHRDAMRLAAFGWPLVGIFILTVDSAIRRALGADGVLDGLWWSAFGWLEWTLFSPLAVWLGIRFPFQRGHRLRFFLVHIPSLIIISTLHSALFFVTRLAILGHGGDPGETFFGGWLARIQTHLTLDTLVYGATLLATQLLFFFAKERENEERSVTLERRIAKAELDLMKMQLQPELLTRTLTALERLIDEDVSSAERLIARFGTFLRQLLIAGRSYRLLRDEMTLIRAFAASENIIDGRGAIKLEVSAEAETMQLPTTLLLPLLTVLRSAQERRGSSDAVVSITAGCFDQTLQVELRSSVDVLDDSALRTLCSELSRRASAAESLTIDATGIVYRQEHFTPPEESDPFLIAEAVAAVNPPRPPSLPIAVSILLLCIPAGTLLGNSISLIGTAISGAQIEWSVLWSGVPDSLSAAPVAIFIAWLASRLRYSETTPRRGKLIALGFLAALAPPTFALAWRAVLYLFVSGEGVTSFLGSARELLLSTYRSTDFLLFFGIALSVLAWQHYGRLEQRRFDLARLDTRLLRTHAQVLKLQLNPHFLFNTLNSIAAMLDDDRSGAKTMTAQLRDFLHRVLQMTDRQEIPLEEELELLLAYVAIEKTRFSDRLNVRIAVDEAARQALVPNLLLQPLVENAVQHGLAPLRGGAVSVSASILGEHLRLEVRDNGRGDSGAPKREGIGLWNTRTRLRQLYGEHFAVEIERPEEGYSVALTIPLRIER